MRLKLFRELREQAADESGQAGASGAHPATGQGTDDSLPGGLLSAAAQSRQGAGDDKTGSDDQQQAGQGTDDQQPGQQPGQQTDQQQAADGLMLKLEDGQAEGIPEQFVKDGSLNATALIKAWKDSRAELKTAKGKSQAPKTPEDYTFEVPELADGKQIDITDDDFLMTATRKAAHNLGLSQSVFQEFVGNILTDIAPMLPEPAPDEATEKAKLGKNADAIINGILTWGDSLKDQGILSEAEHKEIFYMGSTAEGISALQKIRSFYGEKAIPFDGDTVGEGLPSKEELYAMVGSREYQENPAYREKVDKQFQQVFGTGASGSSPAGLGVRTTAAN